MPDAAGTTAAGDDALADRRAVEAELFAELTDRILQVARKLNATPHADPDVVPLSTLESLALQRIDRHPGLTSGQLAAALRLRSSNTSSVIRSLTEKGMVRREPDPNDKRAALLHPTPKAADSIRRRRDEWADAVAGVLSDDLDLTAGLRVLTALDDALEESG